MQSVKLICGNAHTALGACLAAELCMPIAAAEVTAFADGETSVHLAEDVLGVTVCVLQPTCTPVSDNLLTLALLVDAARAAGAPQIIALVPYFG